MVLVLAAAWPSGTVLAAGQAPGPPPNYVIGPQDVLQIALFDQEDLGGKYQVDADGTFTFPLIGRVKAGGLTLRDLEAELRRLLIEGQYFRNPQVSVGVDQYRSQRIFVVGEVRNPGTYQLSGEMSLIEAISRAGSTLPTASGEALIVRVKTPGPGQPPPQPPVETNGHPPVEGDGNSDVTRVNLKELQSGALDQNVPLRDGDTIFVPRAETIYVFGQVKSPGAYPIPGPTTVLQALSLAGGVTDRGATNRIRIVRLEKGKQVEQRVALDYVVRPGDTIIVPERFF